MSLNLRSKKTSSNNHALLSRWADRVTRVKVRKEYEDLIQKDNEAIKDEIKAIIKPICVEMNMPVEFIIEPERCVIQAKLFSKPKATTEPGFMTTVSQTIAPLKFFLSSEENLVTLPRQVQKALRRLRAITKSNLGNWIYLSSQMMIMKIQGPKREHEDGMVTVTYNVRTRYDI